MPLNPPLHVARGAFIKPVMIGSVLLLVLVAAWGFRVGTSGDGPTTNANGAIGQLPSASQVFIAPCSTPVTGGKASLVIGALQGNGETYVGKYDLKVSPYFFMNETGSLSMTLPNESIQKLDQGIAVSATGQAVTKTNGKTRKVTATLTPTTKDSGAVTFGFTGGDTKLTFKSTYKRGGK